MNKLTLVLVPLLGAAGHANAQSSTDSAAIRATALDYIDGWYAADGARMERALHPDLDLLTRIQARGLALPSSFVYNGVFYIRVCIANHRTTQAGLACFLETIDEISTEILTGELVYAN